MPAVDLVETESALVIQIPVSRRIFWLIGVPLIVGWFMGLLLARRAVEEEGVESATAFVDWLVTMEGNQPLVGSVILIVVALFIWHVQRPTRFDKSDGSIHHPRGWPARPDAMDQLAELVLHRQTGSFKRYQVTLTDQSGTAMHLFDGDKATARSVADAVARFTGLEIMEQEVQPLPLGPSSPGRTWRYIGFGVILMLASALGVIDQWFGSGDLLFEGSPVESTYFLILSFIVGVGVIRAGWIIRLPTERRPEFLFNAAVLYVVALVFINYAVGGFGDTVRDLISLARSPDFQTWAKTIDLFAPMIALAIAVAAGRLAIERHRVFGLFGSGQPDATDSSYS